MLRYFTEIPPAGNTVFWHFSGILPSTCAGHQTLFTLFHCVFSCQAHPSLPFTSSPLPPLGTSLPGGKLRPLEGSAPFLGWAADDHVRASHGGNTHGRRDTGRRRQKARVVAKPAHFAKKHDFLLKNTKIPQPD